MNVPAAPSSLHNENSLIGHPPLRVGCVHLNVYCVVDPLSNVGGRISSGAIHM